MRIVLDIGGSVIVDRDSLEALADVIKRIKERGDEVHVVVGGGRRARELIDLGRSLGLTEFESDLLGIEVTRANSRILGSLLGEHWIGRVPRSIEDALEMIRASGRDRILVMGGTQPGHTTDAVAALLAEAIGADVMIVATNVDRVYSLDPSACYPDELVEPYDLLDYYSMRMISNLQRSLAGSRGVLDPLAVRILERSRIPCRIVDGRNPDNLEACLKDESIGTTVRENRMLRKVLGVLEERSIRTIAYPLEEAILLEKEKIALVPAELATIFHAKLCLEAKNDLELISGESRGILVAERWSYKTEKLCERVGVEIIEPAELESLI